MLLSLAQLMIVPDFSIVNVALPSIQSQFVLSPVNVQWVVSASSITSPQGVVIASYTRDGEVRTGTLG